MTGATDARLRGTWRTDPSRSSLRFSVGRPGGPAARGSFATFGAELVIAEDGLRLAGSAEAASILMADPAEAAQALARDALDAARHPSIRFACGCASVRGDSIETVGDVALKGVARPVRAKGSLRPLCTASGEPVRVELELAAAIDPREFGLPWRRSGDAHAAHADLELLVEAAMELVRAVPESSG